MLLQTIALLGLVPLQAANDCDRVGCWSVDDTKTTTETIKAGIVKITMHYATGTKFGEGRFQTNNRHRVFWEPIGRGTLYYPDGQRMAQIDVRKGGGTAHYWGRTTYWFQDGRVFARISDSGDRRFPKVKLAKHVLEDPTFDGCPPQRRLAVSGPTWGAMSHRKHFYSLTTPFQVMCWNSFDAYWKDAESRHPNGILQGKGDKRWYSNGRLASIEPSGKRAKRLCWDWRDRRISDSDGVNPTSECWQTPALSNFRIDGARPP